MMIPPLKCLPLILLLSIVSFGQDDYWPSVLSVPSDETETTVSDTDSSTLSLESIVSLYQTFKTKNKVQWKRLFSGGTLLNQQAEYQFVQLNPQSSIHFLDCSGSLWRENFYLKGLDAGIDWTPVISYNKRPNGAVQSNIDVGPVATYELFSLPLKVRGGLYGYVWNDSLTTSLRHTDMDEYHGAPGVYGECAIGNWNRDVAAFPLRISVNALGRSLEGNNLGLLKASALYAHHLKMFGADDSFFIHIGDSLTNGKELYVGDFEGKSVYSNSSWRIKHSFGGVAGVKMERRFGWQPSAYYRYYLNSIAYPSTSTSLDDIQTTGHGFGMTLNSEMGEWLSYQGGLEIVQELEDWLYRRSFTGTSATSTNRDAFIINLSDHHSDIARSNHLLLLKLPFGMETEYSFRAFKDSKQYDTLGFLDTNLTRKINQNENDRVQFDQRLLFRYTALQNAKFEMYGAYGLLYHYYYRAQRSAESRQTREYRLGINAEVKFGKFEVKEHVYTDAEVSDFYFKKIDNESVDPPPYARDVTSTLTATWKLREDKLHLMCKWIEMYHDDGYWYGEDYWIDSSSTKEYYAIERKSTQYWIDIAGEYFIKNGKFTVGCILRDVFQRDYDFETGKYEVNSLDLGYGFEPYLTALWPMKTFLLNMRIKRIFNTQDDERWARLKNWDIMMALQWMW